MRVLVLARFRERADASGLFPQLAHVLGFVPASWPLTDAARAILKNVFATEPVFAGHMMRISCELASVDVAVAQEVKLVLAELARRSDGQALVVGDSRVYHCQFVFAGERAEVLSQVALATQDQEEMARRVHCLEGLGEDGAAGDFRGLALGAIHDSDSSAVPVDWGAVESQFILCTHGLYTPGEIVEVIMSHSPGATSDLHRHGLIQQIKDLDVQATGTAHEHVVRLDVGQGTDFVP